MLVVEVDDFFVGIMKQMYKLINNIITHKKNLSSTLIPLLVLFTIISNLIDNNTKNFLFLKLYLISFYFLYLFSNKE